MHGLALNKHCDSVVQWFNFMTAELKVDGSSPLWPTTEKHPLFAHQ